MKMITIIPVFFLLFCLLPLPLSTDPAAGADPPAPMAPEVVVMAVRAAPTRLSLDIVGEIKALREVDLRARVTGNLINIKFKPGQEVKEGDLLFVIDPGPYQAALATAQAGLAQAKAALFLVQQDVARYKPLLPDNAIPRQVYDQTVAQMEQQKAVVASQKASVDRAKLDLDYTRVLSPLNGRIGLQNVEIGTLVSSGQTSLATVSTLDPVAVYFSVSENDYLGYIRRKALHEAGHTGSGSDVVELVLADGAAYPEKGRIDYMDPTVNPTTGTLTLRAIFPNPDYMLKAGMNSRVRVYYDELAAAILVPQKAVTETLGKTFVTVVSADNKAELRPVKLGPRMGEQWLVESGLADGETIVVEGVQKARSGMTVTPVPAGLPENR